MMRNMDIQKQDSDVIVRDILVDRLLKEMERHIDMLKDIQDNDMERRVDTLMGTRPDVALWAQDELKASLFLVALKVGSRALASGDLDFMTSACEVMMRHK